MSMTPGPPLQRRRRRKGAAAPSVCAAPMPPRCRASALANPTVTPIGKWFLLRKLATQEQCRSDTSATVHKIQCGRSPLKSADVEGGPHSNDDAPLGGGCPPGTRGVAVNFSTTSPTSRTSWRTRVPAASTTPPLPPTRSAVRATLLGGCAAPQEGCRRAALARWAAIDSFKAAHYGYVNEGCRICNEAVL